jgi:hypothetical protein
MERLTKSTTKIITLEVFLMKPSLANKLVPDNTLT